MSFLLCYAGVIQSLVAQWMSNELYTHGFLIPVISGYIVLQQRAELQQLPVRPDLRLGWLGLVAGLTLLLLGHVTSTVSMQQISLLVSLVGTALLLFGRDIVRRVWFAFAYLLFMIPVWEVVTRPLQWTFQWLSADIGARLLRLGGVPVRLQGVFLELPTVTLEVADVCSGIHFLVAILALALPLAYVRLSRLSLHVAVVLVSVIVALVTNGIRVALIGALAYSDVTGPDIHGPGHALQGLFVAVFGILAMIGFVQVLARFEGRHAHTPDASPLRRALPMPRGPQLAITLALASIGLVVLAGPGVAVPTRTPLADLPADIGAWHVDPSSTDRPVQTVVWPIAGATHEVARTYTDAGRAITLQVSYFDRQAQGRELVGEDSSRLHQRDAAVRLPHGDGTFVVREAEVAAATHRRYAMFWYDLNGHITGNRLEAKAWTAWQTLTRMRSNGALVILSTEMSARTERPGADAHTPFDQDEVAPLRADVQRMAEDVLPVLSRMLPD